MARYCLDPNAEKRSTIAQAGDWELQTLDTRLWIDEEDGFVLASTWLLLCPGHEQVVSVTDHLRHEFIQTDWNCYALPHGLERAHAVDQVLKSKNKAPILVVQAGSLSQEEALELENVLCELKKNLTAYHICVFCSDASVRQTLTAADSFVQSSKTKDSLAALRFAAMVHAITAAPNTANCIDLEDIIPALGDSLRPAVFAEFFCDPQSQAESYLPSGLIESIKPSRSLLACITMAQPTLKVMKEFVQRFHKTKSAEEGDEIIVHVEMPILCERSADFYSDLVRCRICFS